MENMIEISYSSAALYGFGALCLMGYLFYLAIKNAKKCETIEAKLKLERRFNYRFDLLGSILANAPAEAPNETIKNHMAHAESQQELLRRLIPGAMNEEDELLMKFYIVNAESLIEALKP